MQLPIKYGRPPIGPVETKEQAVYFLSVPSGHAKIGIAKDPEARARLLQCGNPERITLVGATQISDAGVDPREMERRIHRFLGPYRTSGEWFRAPADRIYLALKAAWLSLARPAVIQRYERLKARQSLGALARRLKAETSDPDVLELCELVLALEPDTACPVCAAHRAAKAALQRRWRAKQRG